MLASRLGRRRPRLRLPVSRESVESVRIVHGVSLTDYAAAKGIPLDELRVERLDEPGHPLHIPPRNLSVMEPYSTVVQELGIDIRVRILLVNGLPVYFVEEPPVNETVRMVYAFINDYASRGEEVDWGNPVATFRSAFKLAGIDFDRALLDESVRAGLYYAWRDLAARGPFEAPMTDPYVEEVSWYDHRWPMKVVDKQVMERFQWVEFIDTNILVPPHYEDSEFVFAQEIRSMVEKTGKGLTVARPVLEGTLREGEVMHRVAAHTGDVSRDAGITIRKFPKVRYSLTDLIARGVLSPLMAAHLLYLLLHRKFVVIIGGMGSGKTTLLGALLSAIPSTFKVITTEDTPELSTPADNHHAFFTREAPPGSELMNVDHKLLLRHSLRHRGFAVTLSEARGEETSILFQAAASGHAAATTFHAESVEKFFSRLKNPPINAPPENILLVSAVVQVGFAFSPRRGRVRVVQGIYEPVDVRDGKVVYATLFKYVPYLESHRPPLRVAGRVSAESLRLLWSASKSLKLIGEERFGREEAPRVVVELMYLATFIEGLVRRGVSDMRRVQLELQGFLLHRFPEETRAYWEAHRERLLRLFPPPRAQ